MFTIIITHSVNTRDERQCLTMFKFYYTYGVFISHSKPPTLVNADVHEVPKDSTN